MTYFGALAEGLGNVFSWPNIFIPVLGTALSMVSSFLPGIGGSSVAAILILLTVTWDPVSVLLLFGAMTGGATFMGSVTAILFNIPGNSAAAAAMLDGHPLSRQGLPKTAIAAAATSSAIGSLIGVAVLIALMPIVRPFLLEFGPLERLLLGIWGLSTIAAIPNSSALKAGAVSALGLVAACVGTDPETMFSRWSFGQLELMSGFDTIAVLLGFFTLTELIGWRKNVVLTKVSTEAQERDSVMAGILAVFRHYGILIKSAIIGTVVGIIPGVGGTVAGFVAYGQAARSSRGDTTKFGKGDIRGLIAPEAAVDAKDGGSLLPALALGLPGSEAGVILVTVLAIHGLVPGTPMLSVDLSLTFTLIMALLLSNILTSAFGIALAPALGALTRLRIDRIALPILVATLVTVVQMNGSLVDLYVVVGFGLFGYLLKHFNWPRVPFIIAFILGGFIERNFALSVQIIELKRISFFERPAALVIAALIVVSFLWMAQKKAQAKQEVKPVAHAGLFSLALALFCTVLIGVALMLNADYSPYAIAVISLGTALCYAAAFRDLRAVPMGRLKTFDRSHMLPLISLGVLISATALLGLPIGLGVMVVFWLLSAGPVSLRQAAMRIAIGLLVSIAAQYYLSEVAHVIVPKGLIIDALF